MINKSEAGQLIKPIQADINSIILGSWRKIHESNLSFQSRSRACLMWDEILASAKLRWCDSDFIYDIQESNQTAHYWLNENVFFRFKKSDENGYTSNYPTQQAMEFHNPQSDMFSLANKLEVTYVLNKEETEIIEINVVYRNNNKVDFMLPIFMDDKNIVKMPAQEILSYNNQVQTYIAKLKNKDNKNKTVEKNE